MVGLVKLKILLAYVHQSVIALQILAVKVVKSPHVVVIFLAIMVRAVEPKMLSVNAIKRMENQNIMVKVVICLPHATVIHVRMVGHVPA